MNASENEMREENSISPCASLFLSEVPLELAAAVEKELEGLLQSKTLARKTLGPISKKAKVPELRSPAAILNFGVAISDKAVAYSLDVDQPPEALLSLCRNSCVLYLRNLEWDACSVSFYTSGRYRAGAVLAGEGTDFDPLMCIVCIKGELKIVTGAVGELFVEDRREGNFVGPNTFIIPTGGALMWDWSLGRQGDIMALPSVPIDRTVLIFRTLNTNARARLKPPLPPPQEISQESRVATPVDTCMHEGLEDHRKTPSVETEHVRAVYDTIAEHWSLTRHKPWPKVSQFLQDNCSVIGSLIADVGCGNGKYYGSVPSGALMIGCDTSFPLMKAGEDASRAIGGSVRDMCVADAVQLPYRDESFDASISIALLHHLSLEERRLAALSEMRRILKPGGTALVYAWAMEQGEESVRAFSHQDMLVPWHHSDVVKERSEKQDKPNFVEEGQPAHGYRVEDKRSTVFQRYCHLYVQGELEKLVEKVEGFVVLKSYYDCSNWCVVAQRVG